MICGAQKKILLKTTKDGLVIDEEFQKNMGMSINPEWKLVRERDGLIKRSSDVKWLEFNEDGSFKSDHVLPKKGLSLIMSPFNQFFTWQTTSITEILEENETYIKFKTENSNYELFKIINNEKDITED